MTKKIYKLLLSTIACLSIHTVQAQYCTPMYDYGCEYGDDISRFVFNGETSSIDNSDTEGCTFSAYADLTATFSANVNPGGTYSGSVENYYSCCQYVAIWIDYNENGVFETSERVYMSGEYSSSTPANFSITIPTSVTPGSKTMRVRSVYAELDLDPCAFYYYGETHDYTLIINAPCAGPDNVTSTTTATTATISWDDVGTPISTVVEYGPTGFTMGTGTIAVSVTSPIIITDLIPSTTYDFYIKHQCAPLYFSYPDETYTFTTPCVSPSITDFTTDEICGTGSIELTAASTPGSTIEWYNAEDPTTIIHTGTNFITPDLTETTVYQIIASAGVACTSDPIDIVVNVHPIPSLTVTPDLQYACINDFVDFNATVNPNYSYSWSNGETTPTITVNEEGIYTVDIIDEHGCTNTASGELIVYEIAQVDGFDMVPEYFSNYKTVHFSPINAVAVTDYFWEFGDGNTSTEMAPVYTYADSGTYTVKLTVSNECTSDSSIIDIFVKDRNTGVENADLNSFISIYPNPVSNNVLNIVIDNQLLQHITDIEVYNVLGQRMSTDNITLSHHMILNLSTWSSGQYFIKINTEQNDYFIQKIIKQ